MRKERIMQLTKEEIYTSPLCKMYNLQSMSVVAISAGFTGFGSEDDWGAGGGSGITPGFDGGFGGEDNWGGGGGITPIIP